MSKYGTEYLRKLGLNAVNISGGLDQYGADYDSRIIEL